MLFLLLACSGSAATDSSTESCYQACTLVYDQCVRAGESLSLTELDCDNDCDWQAYYGHTDESASWAECIMADPLPTSADTCTTRTQLCRGTACVDPETGEDACVDDDASHTLGSLPPG